MCAKENGQENIIVTPKVTALLAWLSSLSGSDVVEAKQQWENLIE